MWQAGAVDTRDALAASSAARPPPNEAGLAASYRAALRAWRVWTYLARRDLREQYARTLLGGWWVLLSLLLWSAGVGVVYGHLFDVDLRQFLPYVASGFALWGFLGVTLVEGASAFTMAEGYVRQFNLPLPVYLLRVLVRTAMVSGVGLLVPLGLSVTIGGGPRWGQLLVLPGLALVLLAGFCHIVLAAHVTLLVRDFPHAAGSLMHLLFLGTPIVYTVDALAGKGVDWLYLANPFFHLLEVVRRPLLHGAPPEPANIVGAAVYLAVVGGLAAFVQRRMDRRVVFWL